MVQIAVRKLPVDPGPAAWNNILPSQHAAQPLGQDMTADWIVIGAGFAGLAAARRLSQLCPSDRIAILEAKSVASGPAGRNSGFMIDLPHDLSSSDYGGAVEKDKATIAENRHAIAFAAEMAAEFGMGADVFDPRGKINGAATTKGDAHNRKYADHLTALGEDHRILDAAEMEGITGTTYYRSGLYTAGTVIIQPAAFIRSVAAGITSNRVQLFEDSPVTSLKRDGDWVAQTPGGAVRAPKVILAVNGHLNSFGFKKNRLMHVFTYASMTRPLTAQEAAALGGEPVWGLTPADPMGTTVRRIQSGQGDRIVIRNRFTFDPTMQVDDQRIANVGRDHDRAFAVRFPMLKGVDMAYRWGGRLCLSLNGVNVVQELETGLFSACCQNGLGTTRGTLSGIRAAEMATGHPSDPPIAEQEPRLLPPAPIAKLGAAMRLKWQERKAGAEL